MYTWWKCEHIMNLTGGSTAAINNRQQDLKKPKDTYSRHTMASISLEMAHYFPSEMTNNGMAAAVLLQMHWNTDCRGNCRLTVAIHHAVDLMTHTRLVKQPECQIKSKATEITFSVLGKATKIYKRNQKTNHIKQSLKKYLNCILLYL